MTRISREPSSQDLQSERLLSGRRTIIGQPPSNHWIHDDDNPRFDLTRPAAPDYRAPSAGESITLRTTTTPITISPSKTALAVIDMQNFFLSTALGRQADGPGHKAKTQLLKHALPAAALAGIQVIWLNWGLTQDDIDEMPGSILRAFGFKSASSSNEPFDELGKPRKLYQGLGKELGSVTLEDGTTVDGGRTLMRDMWNTALPPDLDEAYQSGLHAEPPHVWVHKNRMSGLWGSSTGCTRFLDQQGIRTLLFAGVNTDQCVAGSLFDAYNKGYDCILLKDVCGTTSPDYATQCIEYNVQRSWGFVTDSKIFQDAVSEMIKQR